MNFEPIIKVSEKTGYYHAIKDAVDLCIKESNATSDPSIRIAICNTATKILKLGNDYV